MVILTVTVQFGDENDGIKGLHYNGFNYKKNMVIKIQSKYTYDLPLQKMTSMRAQKRCIRLMDFRYVLMFSKSSFPKRFRCCTL